MAKTFLDWALGLDYHESRELSVMAADIVEHKNKYMILAAEKGVDDAETARELAQSDDVVEGLQKIYDRYAAEVGGEAEPFGDAVAALIGRVTS